jgi:hypothetical protein
MRVGLLIALLALCVGCGKDGAFETIDTPTPAVSDIPDANPLAYPKLYVDEDLPQYPAAILTDLGRQTTSLRDGIKLQAVSNDGLALIIQYFIPEMEKRGWTYDKVTRGRVEQLQDMPMDMIVFVKGKLHFSVTASKIEDEQTKIMINFSED